MERFRKAGSILEITMLDDLRLVPAMALASSFWSRVYDSVAAVPSLAAAQENIVSQDGGVSCDAREGQRCSWTRWVWAGIIYKLCAGRVLPCKRLKRKGVSVADIAVD